MVGAWMMHEGACVVPHDGNVYVPVWGPKDRFLKYVTWLNNATTRLIWVRPDQLISHPSDSVGTDGRLSGTRGGFCSDKIVC